ncbi:MAG: winged helix-turn-helix transcriptional regulator [Candidatus Bathyarchaeia archaeon]
MRLSLSIDIAKLGKILNDETRLRILRILKKSGSLSYVDLMDTLGITNTGLLNYDLKVLGHLIKKDGEEGKYLLSQKGAVALDFMDKFQKLTTGIGVEFNVAPIPFEKIARSLQVMLAIELVTVAVINLCFYLISPAAVSLHYNLNGQALSSIPKEIFLVLAALLNIPQVVFLTLSTSRYRLINRYPFAVSLPGFHSNLSQMDYERRGYWINRLFSEILITGLVVGAMMIFLSVSVYESALSQTSLSPFALAVVIAAIAVTVAILAYRLMNYSREMATDSKSHV